MELIINQALKSKFDRDAVEAHCTANGVDLGQCCNDLALLVAKHFDLGTMSYEDADTIMNRIFQMMVDDPQLHYLLEFSQPAFSIYLAFDEGEYDHAGSHDPVEAFTRPQIRKILKGV